MAAVVWGLCFFAFPAQAKYGGGTGEPNDPYLIYTAEQMNAIGANPGDWDKHFILMADIDLSGYTGTSFNIIGNRDNRFTGTFDGNGHAISNFSYTSTDTDYVGLFGYVRAENAEIKNLGLIEPEVDAGTSNYVGSLVGWLHHGTITNCCVAGGSVAGGNGVGGLVGLNRRTINNCYSTGSVTGNSRVGGLVGDNYGGTITNCYSKGDVSGYSSVGGLVGYNRYGKITHCYSTGSASGGIRVGGLVGWNKGSVWASFWDIETSGQSISAGGTGLPTDEMQTASTFIVWGCEPVWTIDEGNDYPRLVWENVPGEFITVPSDLYGGGAGDPNDPYLIYTAEQLNMIGLFLCNLDKHFKLMADIDLSGYTGTSFNFIGTDYYYNPFSGVFDGNNLKIYNFTYDSNDRRYIGLFGYIRGENAEIKDLGVINPYIEGTFGYVGSLVGINGGNITNCYVEGGSVSGTSNDVGGLVGYNGWNGTITNCYTSADVAGDDYVGGLVGYNNGTITNCYSTGSVSGDYRVGGLVGENGFSGPPGSEPPSSGCTISNCYSTGSVSGKYYVGGLVGVNDEVTVSNSFWDIETSGQTWSDGGTGLPTDEMQIQVTFTDAEWDFVGETANGTDDIWWILEGLDYPRLRWENHIPIADTGPYQVVECACNTNDGTKVTLDGTGSYDLDGDLLTYIWTGPFVESPAQGATLTVALEDGCPGGYVITLVVNDGTEYSEPNDVMITVVDTTPPEFALSVNPTTLWPPSHQMVKITPTWTVSDKCDAMPGVSLVSISINESNTKGNGRTDDDVQIGNDGSLYLRAERSGKGNDRVYTITYQASDDCGNATLRSATVTVPHDQR